MGPIFAIAAKDLRLLCRDRMDMFFTFVFPLFIAIFFGSIFAGSGNGPGGGNKMHIALVDEDRSPSSQAFAQTLAKSEELDALQTTPAGQLTRAQGEDLVRKGDRVACVVLPKGFGAGADNLFRAGAVQIEGVVDPSRKAESGMLTGILTKYAFQNMASTFTDSSKMREMARKNLADLKAAPGMDPTMKAALESFLPSVEKFFTDADAPKEGGVAKANSPLAGWNPVNVDLKDMTVTREDDGPKSSYAISFPQAVIWGILGCVTSFAVSLNTERSGGTLVRLMMAPIRRWQILAGKAVGCFITCILVSVVVLLLGRLVFSVAPRSFPMLAAAVLCTAIGFVGVMMLVATIGKSAGGSSGLGRAVLLVLAMIGGGSIPLFAMPQWMQTMSSVSPFKWAIQALDGAIWRPLTPAELAIPCAVLLGFGAIGFALGAKSFAWTERA